MSHSSFVVVSDVYISLHTHCSAVLVENGHHTDGEGKRGKKKTRVPLSNEFLAFHKSQSSWKLFYEGKPVVMASDHEQNVYNQRTECSAAGRGRGRARSGLR